MAVRNRTAYAILGFLTRCPMSGYDIKKAVEESVDNFWKESFGQIYPILRRLSQQGLVAKTTSEVVKGERPRHVYAITDKGRKELRHWLTAMTEPPRIRNELLLKLFFGGLTDRAGVVRLAHEQSEIHEQRLREYEELSKQVQSVADPHTLATLDLGLRFERAVAGFWKETASRPPRRGRRR